MATFIRTKPAPQAKGSYQTFRPHVQKDFKKTCHYCLLEELLAGGEENFELDHFKPKRNFPQLTNDFYNLYWSCHPCNHIKLAKWPSQALTSKGIGFVDLCRDDFATHFAEGMDGAWVGLTDSGRYTIDALALNRSHLVELRKLKRTLGL